LAINGGVEDVCFTVPNGRLIVNYKLGGMWKEMVVSCFKVLSQHLPGGTKEYCRKH
jgi:hypothetical protein